MPINRRVTNFNFTTLDRGRIILFANLKGGVGKSSISANLAAHLANQDKRVLAIDLDWQGSLTRMCLTANQILLDEEQRKFFENGEVRHFAEIPLTSVCESLVRYTEGKERAAREIHFPLVKKVITKKRKGFDVVGTDNSLMGYEDAAFLGFYHCLLQGQDRFDVRLLLANLFIEWAGKYDYVIIDTPPRTTVGLAGALAAADHIIVPTQGDQTAFSGVDLFVNTLSKLAHPLWMGQRCPKMSLLLNDIDGRSERTAKEAVNKFIGYLNPRTFFKLERIDTVITTNAAFIRSIASNITDYREFAIEHRRPAKQFDVLVGKL